MCVALVPSIGLKLEQHAFFIFANLVQLKDGACEGKTLTRQSFTGSVSIFEMFFQHL